jgi:hypothetical protein
VTIPKITFQIACAAVFAASPAAGQKPAEQPVVPFRDNSFLIEEAFNQDPGVVQHIFQFQRATDGSNAEGSFTQEWPVGGIRHQLSYEIPMVRRSRDLKLGLGDIALNYRLQALGGEGEKLWFAPRFTFRLPTGRGERGRGSYGVGIGLPFSFIVNPAFTTHTNFGVTHVPGGRGVNGRDANAEYLIGQSVIYTALPQIHFMLESVWTGGDENSFTLSPGVRAALNFSSGLQIVPGIALPYERRAKQQSVLFYLSFEHPFSRAPSR